MATYKEIRGTNITAVDSDPDTALGKVFYNNSGRVLKGFRLSSDAFANGGNLGTGRYSRATFGIQTSAVFAGGSPPSTTQGSEHYDGSSWTAGGNMNTSRRNAAGCGVLTAGLAFGGAEGNPITAAVEEYNGSSWTSVTSMPTQTRGQMGAGTQTAAFACGGANNPSSAPPGASVDTTYEYDGTNWTSGGDMGHGRNDGQGCGTLTAGLAVGGRSNLPPYPAIPAADTVEEYNGTSWTAGGAYPTAMNAIGNAGLQTAAIICGGNTGGNIGASNTYDGSTFSSSATLNTARGYLSGCGTQAAGLFSGGGVPPYQQTEEYTLGSVGVVTIDTD
jgi:hypothetical protein